MSGRGTWHGRLASARSVGLATAFALLTGLLSVVSPTAADAAGTTLFYNPLTGNSVAGTGNTGTLTKPTATGTNQACLTAAGNSSTAPLLSCSANTDTAGSGRLRLTAAGGNQVGGVFGATSFPTSSGVEATFNSYQYGGSGADGMSFVLAAVDPTNPVAPATTGQGGGALGYANYAGGAGLPYGYLGVGLDVYGSFSSTSVQGNTCPTRTNMTTTTPNAVAVRGPGNGTAGYCGLNTTYTGVASSAVTLRSTTTVRSSATAVPVQVLVNPGSQTYVASNGQSVAAGSYKVVVTPVGSSTPRSLTGTLPTVASGLYPASYLNAGGVPKQLAFGLFGSTGGLTDYHEATNLKVTTFTTVPALAVSTTSYAAATPGAGGPVSYVITPSILPGQDVKSPVVVTHTAPAGVKLVGGFGSGWTCAAQSEQSITCTTTASTFTNGTTLPVVNVVGIATSATLSASTVQSESSTTVSSDNANPGSDASATAGTRPTAPTGVTLSPSTGAIAGGGSVTISGSNIAAATAVEIGTTAEQQAGTPVTLLPCSAEITTDCFTVSGSTLVVSSWPDRPVAASTTVTVVSLGIAGTGAYTYTSAPAMPAAPTATAGPTRVTLGWTAPASNGSAITGYTVRGYRNGVLARTDTVGAGTTTITYNSVTPGVSYTFTVAATNANGTSAASPLSNAAVPYTVPDAPSITSTTAGTESATLSWNAPASNGFSAITGYVVTPFVNGVAQTPQTFSSTGTTQTLTGLTAGTAYTFTVAAQNAAGTGAPSAASTAVTPNANPSLTFPDPPSGEVGVAYSQALTVNDGTSPFTWAVSAGSLPPGLTLSSAGLLSGTPTTAGSYTFTVRVTDASGRSATKQVTLTVAAAPSVAFSPAAGEVSVPYRQTATVSGGTGPFTWSVRAGALPAGLSLDLATGVVSGTPTASGSFGVTLGVQDSFGQSASKAATIVIAAVPTFSFSPPSNARVGVAYSTSLTVSGGTAPLTWSVTAGALPAGLALNTSTGVVSGTPTTTGTSSFTVGVADSFRVTASRATSITVNPGPVTITKTANVSSVAPGGTVSYTITLANTGTSTFSGVTLTDPLADVLDDATYDGNAVASSGSAGVASSNLTWTGDLAPSATATITYSVTVANPVTGNQVLAGTVTSSTLGTTCPAGGTDSRCTPTVTVSGLSVVSSANVATTTPGSTVTFSVVVRNTGQTPYAPATLTQDLAGILDDATYNADASASAGTLTVSGATLSWSGPLAPGASAAIRYTATVTDPDPDPGNRSLTALVTSPSAGSVCPSDNPAPSCRVAVQVLVPALAVTASSAAGPVVPGDRVPYTLTIANTGQTPYTGARVNVDLSGVADDAVLGTFTANTGTVTYSSTTAIGTWTGDVPVGATVTVSGFFAVRNPDPGDRVLTAVASSSAPGSTCPPSSTNAACTTRIQVRVPQLTIATATDVSTTTPGSTVGHTITVTNTGETDYIGAVLTDDLAGLLDDATPAGPPTATRGGASYADGAVSWRGDLPVGASATITYAVTVLDPDTGDRRMTSAVTSTTSFVTCPVGGTDTRCRSDVRVLVPGLALTTTADVTTTTPGSVVRYTTTATNTGETTYSGMVIRIDGTGVFDDANRNADTVATSGDLTVGPDGALRWTLTLAPGASATTTLSVTVKNPDPGDRLLVSTVSSPAQGSSCLPGSSATGCRLTVPVLRPALLITKTADRATVLPGGQVTYTVTMQNTGETTQTGATVVDDLSGVVADATYGGGATATSGTVGYSAPRLVWTGTLAPGASASFTYAVTVRDPDPGDKLLVNPVFSNAPGSNCTASSNDSRCVSTVTVTVPELTITSRAGTASTVPGDRVELTVTVANTGATAYAGATLTQSLDDLLDDATVTEEPTVNAGTVTRSRSALSWTGDLAVGAKATIRYAVTVRTAVGGNNLLLSTVASTTRGATCPAGGSDARCNVSVPVARLDIERYYPESTATPGSVVHLRAKFTNLGQVPYTGITISIPSADTVDDLVTNGDQVASSGTLLITPNAFTWTGDIAVGQTVTVVGTLTVSDPPLGDRQVTGTVVTSAPGSNCGQGTTDPRCTARLTVLVPQLSITTTASTSYVVPGGTAGYTVTIANIGETPYAGATVTNSLVGVLDDATYDGNAVASRGTVTYASPTLTWAGDLAVGESATVTYSVTSRNPATGDKSMLSTAASTAVGSTCPPGSGADACRAAVAVLTPALTIIKTADVTSATLGSPVTYTIRMTNSGQVPYGAAQLSDPLAGVLDDATFGGTVTASSGSANYSGSSGQTISWSAPLAVGASATIGYTVVTRNPTPGDAQLVNTVVSSSSGSNCVSGSTDSGCTSTVAVIQETTLTYTKTADVRYATAGSDVTYRIDVRNAEPGGDLRGAAFTDALAGVLDDATYNGDATATSGTVSVAGSTLTWSPAPGGTGTSATITYSVRVKTVVAGDQVLDGQLVSQQNAVSQNCGSGSTDTRCASRVPVARLTITQAYDETTTTPRSLVHRRATFTNTGAYPYENISITTPAADIADDAVGTGDQTASSGTLVVSSTAITWTGSIPVGATVTVTGTLRVTGSTDRGRVLQGTMVTSAPGSNCASGSADARCTARLPVLVPHLSIRKTASASFVVPGGGAGYTITLVNDGETSYSGATVTDNLSGVLDDATYDQNAAVTSGSVGLAGSTLTWTTDLAVGASATMTYSVTSLRPSAGDKVMANRVGSTVVGSTCPPASGDRACFTIIGVLTPALTVTSTASRATAAPGDVITYTVTAENTGQVSYADAAFEVPLADVLDDATLDGSPTASSGTATVSADTLRWQGNLATGARASITYTVTVRGQPANHRLVQTVRSDTQGSTCATGSSDSRCATSVPVVGLRIINNLVSDTLDPTTTQPGATVHVNITLSNTGQVDYADQDVTIDFTRALDDALYLEDAVASSGDLTLVQEAGVVVWRGNIPVGQTVTITGSATVYNPVPPHADKSLVIVVSTGAAGSNCPTGSTDPACRTAVPVLVPQLAMTAESDVRTTNPGGVVRRTVTITNSGETPYVGATVVNNRAGNEDDATYNNDATATRGSVTLQGGRDPVWTGDLAVGESAVVRYSVTVRDPDPGDKVLLTVLESDEIGSSCPTGSADAACRATIRVLVPALDFTLTPDRSTATPGSRLSYTLTIHNSGQAPYRGATAQVDLAGLLDDAAYAGGTATTGAVTGPGPGDATLVTWTGDLDPGATAVVTFAVVVADPDLGDRQLRTSIFSTAPGSSCSAGSPCSSSVAVLVPALALSTTADAATATPGDAVNLTLLIRNTGETAYADVTVTTALDDLLDDATIEGTPRSTTGTLALSGSTLIWRGSLAVGATTTVTYRARVKPVPGDKLLRATATSAAAGSTCSTGLPAPACTAEVTVLVPALTITKTADVATTTPGSVVRYTITLRNTGETAYAAARVTDDRADVLQEARDNGDATATSGVLDMSASRLAWTGALAVGASASITYTVTVDAVPAGDRLLVNTVTSTDPGSSCPTGTTAAACTSRVRVLIPALAVTKSADTARVVAGDPVRYTITVANTGETDQLPAVVTDDLSDVLDDAAYAGDATATSGTVGVTGQTLLWSGPLAVGQRATITYSVRTRFPAAGDRVLRNAASSPSRGASCGSAGCATVIRVAVPALTLTKTADTTRVVAGSSVRYTVAATNTGESDYASASFTDNLAGVLDHATYVGDATATSGTVTASGGSLTWTGPLDRGDTVLVTYTVAVEPVITGVVDLVNTVTSATLGSTCPSGPPAAGCSVTTAVDSAVLTLRGLADSFTLTGPPGAVVTQTEAVSMTVLTNNPSGYAVTVRGTREQLVPLSTGNPDRIPLDDLGVRPHGGAGYTPLSTGTPVVVHQQAGPSAAGGDALSNDYQVAVPDVASDTYTTDLEYVVVAQ